MAFHRRIDDRSDADGEIDDQLAHVRPLSEVFG
jgi:hypothetical protein